MATCGASIELVLPPCAYVGYNLQHYVNYNNFFRDGRVYHHNLTLEATWHTQMQLSLYITHIPLYPTPTHNFSQVHMHTIFVSLLFSLYLSAFVSPSMIRPLLISLSSIAFMVDAHIGDTHTLLSLHVVLEI